MTTTCTHENPFAQEIHDFARSLGEACSMCETHKATPGLKRSMVNEERRIARAEARMGR
jgi:hypothetical protein